MQIKTFPKVSSFFYLTHEVTTQISERSERYKAKIKFLLNKQTIQAKAQRESYEVAYLIAQAKSHTQLAKHELNPLL